MKNKDKIEEINWDEVHKIVFEDEFQKYISKQYTKIEKCARIYRNVIIILGGALLGFIWYCKGYDFFIDVKVVILSVVYLFALSAIANGAIDFLKGVNIEFDDFSTAPAFWVCYFTSLGKIDFKRWLQDFYLCYSGLKEAYKSLILLYEYPGNDNLDDDIEKRRRELERKSIDLTKRIYLNSLYKLCILKKYNRKWDQEDYLK